MYKNNIREISVNDITYNNQVFYIDPDYTKIYYNDEKLWGTLHYRSLVDVGAWGTHLTLTPLVEKYTMESQYFSDAISNKMIALQNFLTTTGAIPANTTIQISFCIGIKPR